MSDHCCDPAFVAQALLYYEALRVRLILEHPRRIVLINALCGNFVAARTLESAQEAFRKRYPHDPALTICVQ